MIKKKSFRNNKGDVTFDLQVFHREGCRDIFNQLSKSEFMLYAPLLGSGFCSDDIVFSADHPISSDPFYDIDDLDLNMKVHAALMFVTKHLCEKGVEKGEVYAVKLNLPTLKQLDEDSIEGYVASKVEGN